MLFRQYVSSTVKINLALLAVEQGIEGVANFNQYIERGLVGFPIVGFKHAIAIIVEKKEAVCQTILFVKRALELSEDILSLIKQLPFRRGTFQGKLDELHAPMVKQRDVRGMSRGRYFCSIVNVCNSSGRRHGCSEFSNKDKNKRAYIIVAVQAAPVCCFWKWN